MKTVTHWFDEVIHPKRVGVYERKAFGRSVYSYWDGMRWALYCSDIEGAFNVKQYPSAYQLMPWRGLAVKPRSGIKTRKPQAK